MPRAIFEMVEFTGGEERSFVLANVFTFPGQEFRQDRRDCYLFRVPCFPIRNAHARADTYGYPIFSEFFHRPSTDFSSTDPLYTLGHFSPAQAPDVVCFASKRLQSQLNWQATSKSRAARSWRNNRSQLNNGFYSFGEREGRKKEEEKEEKFKTSAKYKYGGLEFYSPSRNSIKSIVI